MNIYIIILLFVLFLLLKDKHYNSDNIETFLDHLDVDDIQYVATNGSNSNGMLNNYFIKFVPEFEKSNGLLSDISDYMGIDSHHYLFESPYMDKKYDDKPYHFKKNISAYLGIDDDDINNGYIRNNNIKKDFGRPITYPSRTDRDNFLKNEQLLDRMLIVEPHEYRHPESLGNKIVYDFSNSIDYEHEMRERELRLRGFHRSSLTETDDYTSMTFCDDVDEEGTDFPCDKFGLEFNYDLENRLKLAKYRNPETHPNMSGEDIDYINNISANICCKK